MSDLPFHELANIFPLIEGGEFDALVADIREHGVREKGKLLDGSILDGRNRYRAAKVAGRDMGFELFDPAQDGDPLAYVLSKNLARRHLNESQRAMVAARLAQLRQGHRASLAVPEPMPGREKPLVRDVGQANRHLKTEGYLPDDHAPANLPVVTQVDASKAMNVSERSLRTAKAVLEAGTPELMAAVDRGKLAVHAAAPAAKLAPAQQNLVAREAEAGRKATAATILKQEIRRGHEVELAKKQLALPDKKYGVILADPEWEFVAFSAVTGMDRSPANHYATSDAQTIAARDVQKLAAPDCVCALWTTDLARGIRVLEMWGFTFKSYFVWVKDIVQTNPVKDLQCAHHHEVLLDGEGQPIYQRYLVEIGPAGLGYWNRDRDEILLIGTRGNIPCPAPGTQGESVWFAARPKIEGTQRGKHSAKPPNAHEWIEKHYPHLPKIELNARTPREGWDCWGADVAEPSEAAA